MLDERNPELWCQRCSSEINYHVLYKCLQVGALAMFCFITYIATLP